MPHLVREDRVNTEFRNVMGHFPTGVAIITGTTDEGPAGLTIQSFMALSIDPPLILVSVDRKSQSWPKIHASKRFAVNILSSSQQDVALRFARSGGDKFTQVACSKGPASQAPLLEGVQAWIECEIRDVYGGGDHEIVTATVLDLGCNSDPTSHPLLFGRSKFLRIDPDA